MEKKFNSKRLNALFEEHAEDYTFSELKDLMLDTVNGDLDGATKKQAEETIRKFMLDLFEISAEDVTKPRVWRYAAKEHMAEYFELLEEVIERKIDDSLQGNELINQFAEVRNLNEGDKNLFYLQEKTVLSIARVSGGHHDLSLQHFKKPTSFTVGMSRYAVKIGDDIRQYLLNRKNFSDQINAVSYAFEEQIAKDVIAEIANVGSKLPASGDLSKSITMPASGNSVTKDTVREAIIDIIDKVRSINGGSDIIVMGTRNACAKLEAVQDLDWLSNDAKKDKYTKGRIAYFDEATLVTVPQKYVKENDTLKKLIPDDFLLVIPTNAERFVKIVNTGDVATETIDTVGAYVDDLQTYEMQKTFGVATIVGQYIGYIKFA